jgi:hypothetical protein
MKNAGKNSSQFAFDCGQQFVLIKDLLASIRLYYPTASENTIWLMDQVQERAHEVAWKLYHSMACVFERRRGWKLKWAAMHKHWEEGYEDLVRLRGTLIAAEVEMKL